MSASAARIVTPVKQPAATPRPSRKQVGEGKADKGTDSKAKKGKEGKGKTAARATPRRASSAVSGTAGASNAGEKNLHADEGEFVDQEGLDLQVRGKTCQMLLRTAAWGVCSCA